MTCDVSPVAMFLVRPLLFTFFSETCGTGCSSYQPISILRALRVTITYSEMHQSPSMCQSHSCFISKSGSLVSIHACSNSSLISSKNFSFVGTNLPPPSNSQPRTQLLPHLVKWIRSSIFMIIVIMIIPIVNTVMLKMLTLKPEGGTWFNSSCW